MIRVIGVDEKFLTISVDTNGDITLIGDIYSIKEFQREFNIKVSMLESRIARKQKGEEDTKVFCCRECKKLLELDEVYTKTYGSETVYLCKKCLGEDEPEEEKEESK